MNRSSLYSSIRRRGLRRDANFDHLRGWDDGLYGSSFGELRLAVVTHDLLEIMPELRGGGMTILDAGGGAGHLAIRLAELGNDVVLCDPSMAMLARARMAVENAGLDHEVTLVHANIQELSGIVQREFDLVTCHAVLNWLADPNDALAELARSVSRHGRLSLLFGNHNSWVLRKSLQGDFRAVLADVASTPSAPCGRWRTSQQRTSGSMSRRRQSGGEWRGVPLNERVVREWLDGLGFTTESKSGVRVFHDHLAESLRRPEHADDLLKLELAYRKREPFASLGALIHLVCKRIQ